VASGAALAATLLVDAFARRGGRTEIVTLILTGLAVNALATAAVGLATYLASPEQLQDIVFWTLGSLGGASWETVRVSLPFVLVGLVAIPTLGRALDLMVLGEREAGHLGVATERVRLTLIVLCALTAGAGVAVAGVIGFVGLIVPHVIRLLAGPGNRVVLPLSAVAGATLLLLADLVARTAAAPAELPLGVLTAALGGPFFLFLVHRTRGAHGEWA
jgi:iron complex transport system permease protein